MSKHTPGPWMANKEGRIFAGQIDIGHAFEYELDLSDYCDCHADCTNPPLPRLANARLMAAAPELLEMVKRLMPYCENSSLYDLSDFRAAKNLIEKIEGDE